MIVSMEGSRASILNTQALKGFTHRNKKLSTGEGYKNLNEGKPQISMLATNLVKIQVNGQLLSSSSTRTVTKKNSCYFGSENNVI